MRASLAAKMNLLGATVAFLLLTAATPAADRSVPFRDSNDRPHTPLSQPEKKATVLFFLLTDCPISNALRAGDQTHLRGVRVEEDRRVHRLSRPRSQGRGREKAHGGLWLHVPHASRSDARAREMGRRDARSASRRARRRGQGRVPWPDRQPVRGLRQDSPHADRSATCVTLSTPCSRGSRFCPRRPRSLAAISPNRRRNESSKGPPCAALRLPSPWFAWRLPLPPERPTPTFNKDVAPILFSQCASCHRPGEGAPFSLLTYDDAKKRGKLIARVTQSKQMPPWKAEKGDVAFRNERHLERRSDRRVEELGRVGHGRGERRGPPRRTEVRGRLAAGQAGPGGEDAEELPRAGRGPRHLSQLRDLAGAQGGQVGAGDRFPPQRSSVLHHSLFFLDPSGTAAKREADSGEVGSRGGMGGAGRGADGPEQAGSAAWQASAGLGGSSQSGGLGGWAVGGQARALPDGLAYHLPKGSDLILSTHFHPSGKAEEEASTVALYFTDKPPVQRFTGLQLPPGLRHHGRHRHPGRQEGFHDRGFVRAARGRPRLRHQRPRPLPRQDHQGDRHAPRRHHEDAAVDLRLGFRLAGTVPVPELPTCPRVRS